MMERIQKLVKLLENHADCALITDDVNRRYFTGMKSSAGYVLIFPEKSYLLIDFRYIEKARQTVKHCEVIEQKTNVFQQISELLQKHQAKTIALESDTLPMGKAHKIMMHLKNYEFLTDETLSRAVYQLRTIKSADEIQKIKSAQRLAEEALQHLLQELHAGMTEREVALALDFYMRKHGAEDLSFETIALTGAHTSMPHGVPDDRKIQQGDFVLMDFGAVVDGYHSDMTRTVCVGEPSSEMRNVYNIVKTAQETALSVAKAGMTGKMLDQSARRIITEAGYGEFFGHSLGHGVGMEIHEFPVASANVDNLIPEGGVVTIEPGIYLPEKFGVRIEDFIYITKNGCENLTNIPNSLICV